MPQVPDFQSTEQYGFTPDSPTSPGADSAVASALLQGGDNVANAADDLSNRLEMHFAAIRQQQQRTQQMVQASSVESQSAIDLANMRLSSLKDPDYVNAGPNFMAQAQAYKQQTLAGIQDPAVQAYVSQALDKHIAANGISVYQDAFKNGNAAQSATIGNSVDAQVMTAAKAANPADLDASISAINASVQGGVAGQLYTPLQARQMTSNALRQVITLRSLTDPGGAQAVLQKYGSLLNGPDLIAASEHLQPLLNRQAARAAGSDAFNAAIGQPGNPIADAIHGQESGGAATSATSVNGAQGGWQITPGTFAQYAMPGEDINNPADNERVGRRIVDDLSARYNNDPGRVAVAYFSGPGNVAPAGSATPWITDKADGNGTKVSSYVQGVLGRMPAGGAAPAAASSTGPTYPDDEKAEAAISALPDEQQASAWSAYKQQANRFIAGQSQQRAAMNTQLTDVEAKLTNGVDADVPSETDIRRLYPAAAADKIVQHLSDLQQFSTIRKAVDLASPADISQMQQDLANGTGLLPHILSLKQGGAITDQPTTAPDGTPDTTGYADRKREQDLFQQVLKKRNDDLMADPAVFAASRDPALKPLSDALQANPTDPTATAAYAQGLLASQSRLGVPPGQQRILTNAQVQSDVNQLHSADPAKTNLAQAIGGLATQYGSSWPQAFGELVRVGKLDPAYQVLGGMTDPSQIGAQQDLARVLQMAAQKGGLAQLQDAAGGSNNPAVSDIKKGLYDTMEPLRTAYASNPGGMSLIANYETAIEHLATLYAGQGASGADALNRAYQGVVANRWDIGGPDGGMIAPKGKLADVQASATGLQRSLTPADLAPIADTTTGLRTPDEQRAMALQEAQRGAWRPNQDASGLTLTRGLRTGQRIPVLRADGTPVEIKFNALPTPAAPAIDTSNVQPVAPIE